MAIQQLFSAQTANGNSSVVDWQGGNVTVIATGTWDTSTLTLQVSPDGGTTWVATSVTATADAVSTAEMPQGVQLRLNLASVGASTDLDVWIA